MKLSFLLAKDPTRDDVGDTAMMNQLLALVRADYDVSIICWSQHPDVSSADGIVRLSKPRLAPSRVLARAVHRRRSLLHARFDDPELRTAIEASDAHAFVAVHHYMAEAMLRSTRRDAPLYVVNVVPEAPIWRGTRGWLGRAQAPLIARDEARVIRHATSVGSYDKADAAEAEAIGARRSVWLELTLPPRPAVDVRSAPPRLVVLGDRRWAPNEHAWRRMLALWPAISSGVPDAELVAIGHPRGAASTALPPSVTDLGFVDDLATTLAGCRAMAAPIEVGGGIRVKLLEAAAVGLPVAATTAAAGSLTDLLGIEPVDDDVQFVARCRRLLTAPEFAAGQGAQLHAANSAHWESGRLEASVRAWLA